MNSHGLEIDYIYSLRSSEGVVGRVITTKFKSEEIFYGLNGLLLTSISPNTLHAALPRKEPMGIVAVPGPRYKRTPTDSKFIDSQFNRIETS